jgi:hypothetical protein
VFTAKDIWTAVRYVVLPPGWSADGNGETTENLRKQRALATVRTRA